MTPESQAPTTRSNFTESGVMWQVIIHITFIVSAIGIAWVDRLSEAAPRKAADRAKAAGH